VETHHPLSCVILRSSDGVWNIGRMLYGSGFKEEVNGKYENSKQGIFLI